MRKILITALFGAFAVAQETAPAPAASNHALLYSLDATTRTDGDEYRGEHIVRYTYKFADGYKLMPAILFNTFYTKDAAGDFQDSITNNQVRVEWETPKLWDVLGFKTDVRIRYALNTAVPSKDSGSYGAITLRPNFDKEFGSKFSLRITPKLTVHAQRNGYSRANGDRNPLVRAGVELIPSYKFTENLSLSYDLDVGGTYMGDGANGDDNLLVQGDFYHEIELMYNIVALNDLGVGLLAYNDFGNGFGNHAQAEFAKDDETFVGLRIQKTFEL